MGLFLFISWDRNLCSRKEYMHINMQLFPQEYAQLYKYIYAVKYVFYIVRENEIKHLYV